MFVFNIFLPDQISGRSCWQCLSYVVRGSFWFLIMFFRRVGLFGSDTLRVLSMAWLVLFSHIFIFCFLSHQSLNFVALRSETRDVATRVSGCKLVQSTESDIVNGSFCVSS